MGAQADIFQLLRQQYLVEHLTTKFNMLSRSHSKRRLETVFCPKGYGRGRGLVSLGEEVGPEFLGTKEVWSCISMKQVTSFGVKSMLPCSLLCIYKQTVMSKLGSEALVERQKEEPWTEGHFRGRQLLPAIRESPSWEQTPFDIFSAIWVCISGSGCGIHRSRTPYLTSFLSQTEVGSAK